jgi:hypothetical protein
MAPPDLRANGGITEPLRGLLPWSAPSPTGEDGENFYDRCKGRAHVSHMPCGRPP